MKNQPTKRGRETVARVIDAACELFTRRGIRACTLDQVGAASGTGRGQMYHYFSNKADLVAAVVEAQVRRTVDASVEAIDAIVTRSDLEHVGAAVAAHYGRPGETLRCPLGSLVDELGPDDAAAKATVAAGFARWQAAWADALRRLRETNELSVGIDPESSAIALLATYQGAILLAAAQDDATVIRASLDATIGTLLAARAA